MKIIKFNLIIKKIMKNIDSILETQNYENIRIALQNHENHENH